ncbi:unnamed protein product, partial [Notodromas monacha]
MGLDRMRYFAVGAAPVSAALVEYFLSFDIQLFQEYGMTECGPTNIETPTLFGIGSCGGVVKGFNVVVEPCGDGGTEGEVMFDGRIRFMGYAKDPERTSEMIDDLGRIKSGDLGFFDPQGRLWITGRIKDLIVTCGGKKISPSPIEQKLKRLLNPAITSVIVVGESRKFISALFGLKALVDPNTNLPTDELSPEALQWLEVIGSPCKTVSQVIATEDPA